jgi:hypothetical protein
MRTKSRGREGFFIRETTQRATELRFAVEAEPVEPRPQRLGLRDAMAKVFDYCGGTHAPPTPPEPDAPLCVWYGCFDSV